MILTQEQEMIRDSMRAFAQERLAPFAAEWDKHHTFPAAALKELGELGAGHTSVFINLVPVFAVLQAAWLLDERLGLSVLLGGLLVIAGVALTTMHTSQKTTSLEKTA